MIWLALAALAGPREDYEQALADARAAPSVEAFEEAVLQANLALHAGAFGTTEMTIPVGDIARGDFRTSTLEVPAGVEIPREVAVEAARTLDALGQSEAALAFADRTFESRSLVRELLAAAEARGDTAAAERYRGRVEAERRADEARWATQEAADDQARSLFAGSVALGWLVVGIPLGRMGWSAWRERMQTPGYLLADGTWFSGVRITERRGGQPVAWRNTLLDVVGRVMLQGILALTIPGAAVGAWFLGDVIWDHPSPDEPLIMAMMAFLVWLMGGYSLFMTALWPGMPPALVVRRVELMDPALYVRTTWGLLRRWEDLIPWEDVSDVYVRRHEEHVPNGGTVVTWQLMVRSGLDGRTLSLAGAGREHHLDPLVEAVRARTPGPPPR